MRERESLCLRRALIRLELHRPSPRECLTLNEPGRLAHGKILPFQVSATLFPGVLLREFAPAPSESLGPCLPTVS